MDVKQTVAWFRHYADVLDDQKALLTELDAAIGDGDHGANMARGWRAVKEGLHEFSGNVGDSFMLVSKTLISKVGGASGPLYGTAFLRMGMAVKGKDAIELSDWPNCFKPLLMASRRGAKCPAAKKRCTTCGNRYPMD